ncbi:MAG: hypothetical protein HOQ24_07355 [Mycobacteriaceae bacterium]|nr:hypothetical protein [Mycobacteriaceae bacterium]
MAPRRFIPPVVGALVLASLFAPAASAAESAGSSGSAGSSSTGSTDRAPRAAATCEINPSDRAATINALRFNCSGEEAAAVFQAAAPGAVPSGVKDGWVTRTSVVSDLSSALWAGKTFHTGVDGGYLLNRTVIGDQWLADVYVAPSRIDGKPAWALDYHASPTPSIYDEIREVVPGVWFGYSMVRRPGSSNTILLSFVLA